MWISDYTEQMNFGRLMKVFVVILFGALLVGLTLAEDHHSNHSPDLDDPATLEKILGEAVVGAEVKTGWRRINHANGKLSSLSQFKDGRPDGLQAGWHENGQKRSESYWEKGLLLEGHGNYWNNKGDSVDFLGHPIEE